MVEIMEWPDGTIEILQELEILKHAEEAEEFAPQDAFDEVPDVEEILGIRIYDEDDEKWH